VVVVRDGRAGWETAFGEVAIPLGDRGIRLVGELEAANHVATLPAAVGRLSTAAEQVRAMWHMADPFAADGDRIGLERHPSGDAGVLELGDELCDAPVVAASEHLNRLIVVERLEWSVEPRPRCTRGP